MFEKRSAVSRSFLRQKEAMAALSPVLIRFDKIEGGAKGYYHTAYKEIVIQKDMSKAQTMKTDGEDPHTAECTAMRKTGLTGRHT